MSGPGDKLKDGPLYDDLGNLVQAPGGAAPFINERGNIEVRKAFHPDRVVERNAGCWNCRHFDTEQVYDAKVQASRARDVAYYKDQGMPPALAYRKADAVRKFLTTKKGFIGTCTIGKTNDDFVVNRHLCTSWSGAVGASLARAPGEALSPLVGEVLDKLGDGTSYIPKTDDAPDGGARGETDTPDE